MKKLLLAFLILCSASAHAGMPPGNVAAFRDDLALLAKELPQRHANLHHASSREEFETAVAALDQRLPTLERHAAIVELARIVGLARDGHTALFLLPFPGAAPIPEMRQALVQFMDFPDGMRVIAIERAHAQLLGAKLIKVGDVPIAEALARLAPLLPRDNTQGEREYGAFYMALPPVLQALGLSAQAQSARFTMQTRDGRSHEVTLEASTLPDSNWIRRLTTLPGPPENWIAATPDAKTPGWLSRTGEPWWFETLPNGDVYAQINAMRETPDAPFAGFAERVLAAVPKEGTARLILDLRLNRGGNGELSWPLVYAIIRHDAVNRPGRLFAITSRRTFSAAQNLANALEKHTKAQFVGEPTGSSPNHYGELGTLALPKTGLGLVYSMLYFQADPRDTRAWVAPHIAAELSYDDLATGHDPALAAIASFEPPPALNEWVAKELAADQPDDAVAKIRALDQRYRNPWRNRFEAELNTLGYDQLGRKRTATAVALFALATELYPNSSNAWDSLGEARRAAGQRAAAAYAYARAVKLNPKAQYSADALASILGVRQ